MSPRTDAHGAAKAAPIPERIATPIVWLGGAISAFLILVVLCLTTYSVFMRYVLNRPPVWIDDLTGYVLVALVMFGVTEAYRGGNHISIDLLTGRLPRSLRKVQTIWSDVCVIAFAAVLIVSTWHAIDFAISFDSYTSGSIEIASWIPQVPLLVGGVLLALFAVARLLGCMFRGTQQ